MRDVMEPDRVVLGGTDAEAVNAVAGLYAAMEVPIVRTDLQTAELIKYASNAMLATRISFINEIAAICDVFGCGCAGGSGRDGARSAYWSVLSRERGLASVARAFPKT